MENKVIRTCPNCKTQISILDITCNPILQPAGMDSPDGSPGNVCYLFVHVPCGSSMLIPASELRDLLPDRQDESCDSPCKCLEGWTVDFATPQSCTNPCRFERHRRFLNGILQIKRSVDPELPVAEQERSYTSSDSRRSKEESTTDN